MIVPKLRTPTETPVTTAEPASTHTAHILLCKNANRQQEMCVSFLSRDLLFFIFVFFNSTGKEETKQTKNTHRHKNTKYQSRLLPCHFLSQIDLLLCLVCVYVCVCVCVCVDGWAANGAWLHPTPAAPPNPARHPCALRAVLLR